MTAGEIASLPYRPNVGIMLVNAQAQVFVAQRLDSPGPAWQMPQGGIDAGEDPQCAALRELQEETGVTRDLVTVEATAPGWLYYDFPENLIAKVAKGRFRGQKQRWFLIRFHGTDDQIDIQTEHPEFSRWAWIDPGDLVKNIVPFKRDVYVKVLDAFQSRLG